MTKTNTSSSSSDHLTSDRLTIDTLINAKWIIPVEPAGKIFRDCCLAIHKGLIHSIVPQAEAEKRFQVQDIIQLNNHVVIPGLINAHGHSGMSLMKGYADDLALEPWLQDYIWPAEGQWVNENFVKDGCQLAMAEMIRSGTTCFSDMYFHPDTVAHCSQKAGMRCQVYSPILDFPSSWAQNADEYISKALVVHDDFRSSELVDVGFGPHAPYTVSDSPFQRLGVLAEELQAGIHVHLHETANEVAESVKQHGKRPIERLRDLGVLSPLTQCVHMTQLQDSDIELLQTFGCHVIHCPESNLKLASGFCPTHKLLQSNINVALGTDSTASNNDLDMFGEMHTAALLAKGIAQDPTALNSQQTLEMATLNGAKAIGKDDQIGSLKPGKAADITAIKLDGIESQPLFNVTSHLVYTNNGHNVTDVWVSGKALLLDGKLRTLNEAEIIDRSQQWADKLSPGSFHG